MPAQRGGGRDGQRCRLDAYLVISSRGRRRRTCGPSWTSPEKV
jgi:hypothetical protein